MQRKYEHIEMQLKAYQISRFNGFKDIKCNTNNRFLKNMQKNNKARNKVYIGTCESIETGKTALIVLSIFLFMYFQFRM